MKFCPHCSHPLHPALIDQIERLVCQAPDCQFIHWDNPTPVVAAIVEYEGKVLLARNVAWPDHLYALITGFLEKNEIPEEAVLREVKEELNLSGEVKSFVGHYGFRRMNQLLIVFHVEAWGDIQLNEELADFKLVNHHEVEPWPGGTGLAIRDWLATRIN